MIDRNVIATIGLALLACAALPSLAQTKALEKGASTEGLDMQEARAKMMTTRGAKVAYTKKFDLSGLPHYVPQEKPAGTLHVYGNNYVGDAPLGRWWKEAFEKVQPGIHIEYYLPSAAIAIPGLYFGLADVAINHEPSFYDSLGHLRLKGYEPVGFSAFTGSYDYVGWQNNFVIIVNKDNPLAKITLQQLDGIFGSARDGGWVGTTWHPELSRGPEQDIRKWGGSEYDWSNATHVNRANMRRMLRYIVAQSGGALR